MSDTVGTAYSKTGGSPPMPEHEHRYCWGGPEWLAKWDGHLKPPPEPFEYCRCGQRDPKAVR